MILNDNISVLQPQGSDFQIMMKRKAATTDQHSNITADECKNKHYFHNNNNNLLFHCYSNLYALRTHFIQFQLFTTLNMMTYITHRTTF